MDNRENPTLVAEEVNPDVHHETSDVAVRPILLSASAFVVMTVVVFILLWFLFRLFDRNVERSQVAPVSLVKPEKGFVPPAPRLQSFKTAPVLEMQRLREHERLMLSTYGIADPKTGAVRIPIEQAMQLALQRGLPVRVQSPGATGGDPLDSGASSAPSQSPTAAPGMATGYPQQARRQSDKNELVEPVAPSPREDRN